MSSALALDAKTAPPPKVSLRGVTVAFPSGGSTYTAVRDVSLQVPEGSFTAIVGPSGCGKSTLLRVVAGLTRPAAGEVLVDGRSAAGVRRGIGFLFQQDALLPWRTVYENVALGLRLQGVRGQELADRAALWIKKVGLGGFERRYPAQLSGGMRKRAAIAQTLACDPELILMDEPFTHLDAQTRHLLHQDLLELCGGGRTILFVTHDLEEAIALSDAIALMTAGPGSRIQEIEPVRLPRPRDLARVRGEPEFGRLFERLWRHLYEEVRRAYGR